MNTLPPEPSANDPISATFIKALMRYIRANTILNGPGYKTKRGPNGTVLNVDAGAGPHPNASSSIHPFKVFGKNPDSADHFFEIYLPNGNVINFAGERVEIIGVTKTEDRPFFYTIDDEDRVASDPETSYLQLVIYTVKTEDGSSDEEDERTLCAELTIETIEDILDREDVLDIIYSAGVAEISIETGEENDVGRVAAQILTYQPAFANPVYI